MTHRHKVIRGLRGLGKAETAETETARYLGVPTPQPVAESFLRSTSHLPRSTPFPRTISIPMYVTMYGV
jgi:hypothetical protein